MSFQDAVRRDSRTAILNPEHKEFCKKREFGLAGPNRTTILKDLDVIWMGQSLTKMSGVVAYGQLEIADAICISKRTDWVVLPRRGDRLWSPRDTMWDVIQCQELVLDVMVKIWLRQVTEPT